MREGFVDIDETLKIVNEIKILIKEYTYKIDSIKDIKNDYPEKIEKLEEALLNYIVENDLKILKQNFFIISGNF